MLRTEQGVANEIDLISASHTRGEGAVHRGELLGHFNDGV